jgi:hypothetical protein
MAHLTHEQQKQRAQEEAAHHRDNASVNRMNDERQAVSKEELYRDYNIDANGHYTHKKAGYASNQQLAKEYYKDASGGYTHKKKGTY